MEKSAGLVILKDDKILLCHPTNSSWVGTFSIPKGNILPDEDPLQAAIRETIEEIGVDIPIEIIDKEQHQVKYFKKDGKPYKVVYYYIVNLDKFDHEIPDVIPRSDLQLSEVDWAGFLTKEEAKVKIFWRFKDEIFLR